jgi:hypothetical protein
MTGKLTYPEVTGSGFRRARAAMLLSATPGDRDPFVPICVLRDSGGQIRWIRSLRRATCRSVHGTVPAQAGFIRLASRRTCLLKSLQIAPARQRGVGVEVIAEVE